MVFLTIGMVSAADKPVVSLAKTDLVKTDLGLAKNLLDPIVSSLNDYVTFIQTPVNTGGGPKDLLIKITTNQEDGQVSYIAGKVTYDKASNSLVASGDQVLNTNIWTCTQVCSCNPSGNAIDVNQFAFNPKQKTTITATIKIDTKQVTMSNGDSFTLKAGPTGVFYGETSTKVYTLSFFKYLVKIT